MAAPRLVSVIVATRDRPQLLSEALASIRAVEGPDLKFEILVGDNGGLPESREVAERFGAIYQYTSKNGCPAPRNLAMSRATGEFIAFLDDDDVWLPAHIRTHIEVLDANPEFAGAFGQIISTDPDLTPLNEPWPHITPDDGDFFMMLMNGYFPQVGGTLFRASVLESHGYMDESLIGDSDWDWQIRIAADRKFGFVAKPCVLFRQRPKGSFNNMQLMRSAFTRRIFLRHALPNRTRWKNTVAMIRSYYACQMYYWEYFLDVAAQRAARGERWGVVKAVSSAFWIFPSRTLRCLLGKTELRQSARAIFS